VERAAHGLNTVVNTPQERVHPGSGGVNMLSARKPKDSDAKNELVHAFIPIGDEQMNTLPDREHADEHGVNTLCRHCGGAVR